MICERLKEQMPEYLSGTLDESAREKFLAHLESCANCHREVEELGAIWRGLEFLPSPQPNPAMRGRFMEMLEAYQFGLEQGSRRPPARKWLTGLWPGSPVWQAAFSAALIVIGIAAGHFTRGGSAEVTQLKGEVESMRQLVTLSLLQQQSPSARMRGITYSYQVERPDTQVENALLFTVNHDSNVNVRLSAVDALQKYARVPEISRGLIEALPSQDSPLVQIALIDMLVQMNDGAAAPALQKLESDPAVNAAVRQRAGWGLRKLGVS
jgi:hypothetical protein